MNAEYLKGSTYRFPELESDETVFLRTCNQILPEQILTILGFRKA